jgi:hypothetical protein
MEGLVQKGLVRSIGMSNFSRSKLEGLMAGRVAIKPAVLQVWFLWGGGSGTQGCSFGAWCAALE